MGKEEANTEVGKAVANGNVLPDNVVSEKKDGVQETCEDTRDKSKEVNADKVDAKEKEINDSKESEAMEVDEEETANENKIDDLKEKEDKLGSKKHTRKKGGVEKGNSKKASEEEKKEEPKSPVAHRPVRERKSVERLVAVIEKDTAREFHIEKGRGTALKDIPNVAYKLSKKKVSDDSLKLLHTVLFGRRGKALLVKSNILRFSGFVWHENEEKQKAKVQEKLDKYTKEKLFEFCDLLDIPIGKTSAKKEDAAVKLIDFLLLPHITTSELVSEKEQPSKRKKSASTSSSKKQKSKSASGSEEEEKSKEHQKVNGEHTESDSEGESGKKDSASKQKSKQKESGPQAQAQKKASKSNKDQVPTLPLPLPSTPKKSASKETEKEKSGKKAVTEEEEKQKPSDDQLKAAVCEILKQVDFNTASFTDILKLLGKRFNADLIPRKPTIKLMIQDELTKLADVTDDDDQEEEDEGKAS